ncbi:unnamed protein product [Sphagnum balticum]
MLMEKLLPDAIKEAEKNSGTACFRTRKISAEGTVYGYSNFAEKESLTFYPVINKIYSKNTVIKGNKVKAFMKFRYMFRHTAIEIWHHNSKKSILLDFYDNSVRDQIYNVLKQISPKRIDKIFNRDHMLNLWVNGQISNFEYLMMINTIANRSFNDISQYPVFPWIISDYTTSEKLQLGVTAEGDIIDDVIIPPWANVYLSL